MKIFLAQADFSGCGFYRIMQPAAFLKLLLHHEVKLAFDFRIQELLAYDLIIFQRQTTSEVFEAIKLLKALKKTVVYEIDDSPWDLPSDHPKKAITIERMPTAEAIIQACDAVTTSTEPLAERLRRLNKNVYIIPNYVAEINPIPKFESKIRLGWAGSISHHMDFNADIIQAIKDIKQKYKERIEIVFCGWIPDELKGHATYYEFVEPIYYLGFLNQLRLDIGIIPCANNTFNKCKSNLKFLEYSITRTASIASAIYPYMHTITENTGILIRNGTYNEWFEAMVQLIEDASLRNQLSQSAYDFVKNYYLISKNITNMERIYKNICGM
jgi:glycosyltransferase involved in cell wall biosynthesis